MRVLLVLLAGEAMASMDSSILSVTAPSLQSDLHVGNAQLQLVVAAYTIGFASLLVTGARLGDVLGYHRAFLLGLAAFTAASLAGGLAPNAAVLISARAVQGTAAALMTPQVLSLIQLTFEGERRARAIGAYSLILAVGVALGQILGGLLVGAHLLDAAWRPALLINAPVGVLLLLVARSDFSRVRPPRARMGLDLVGVVLLTSALVALVVPLTLGREAGWPLWAGGCLGASALLVTGFVVHERRLATEGLQPLLKLDVLSLPGVAAGVFAVALIMAAYAGFVLALTLHLQNGLGFGPLHSGLTVAAYAGGFAAASVTWTRIRAARRRALPVLGPLVMGSALLTLGTMTAEIGWPEVVALPLLALGGCGHAWGFSPLTSLLSESVDSAQAPDLSGLILTATLIGGALGIAGLVGVYLHAAPQGSAHAVELMTRVLALVLGATAVCARRVLAATPQRPLV